MGNIDNKINQAVITLGGTGSRLNEITMGVPKPLFKIDGLHTLERSIKVLYEQGITKFIWITNYQHEFFLKEAKQQQTYFYTYNFWRPMDATSGTGTNIAGKTKNQISS